MATAKSFTEMAHLYESQVLNEGTEDASKKKQTVGKMQEIGDAKLVKEGGDEKVKKTLEKPTEAPAKEKDGDVEKLSQKETVKESSNVNKSKSLFDKIYQQIVSEDSDPVDGSIPEAPVGDDLGGEAPAAEVVEEVDPVVLVKELCAIVTKLKEHFGVTDEEEVVEVEDEVPAVGEAVDMKEVPSEAGLKLTKKGNDDTKGVKVSGGTATATVTAGDGKLEKAPDGKKLAGNKGEGTAKGTGPAVKGGNASALEC